MGQPIDGEQRFRTKAATQGTEPGQRRPGRGILVLAAGIAAGQELYQTARIIGGILSETAKSLQEVGKPDDHPKVTSLRARRAPTSTPDSDAL